MGQVALYLRSTIQSKWKVPFISGENVTLGQGEEQNQKSLDKKLDQINFSTATFDLDLVTDLQFFSSIF